MLGETSTATYRAVLADIVGVIFLVVHGTG